MTVRVAPPWRRGELAVAVATDEELVARCWTGDEVAVATLLDRYGPLVRRTARPYFLVGGDRDDVVQEGMIGLYKAVRDYDPARGVSFRAFAELCTTRQILTAVKTATRRKHAPLNSYVSLHLPGSCDDDGSRELLDRFPSGAADPADSVVSDQECTRLERACWGILSDLEVEVLERYVDGASYSEIADELDRHVKSVDNAIQRIRRKLDLHLREHQMESVS